MSVRVSDEKLLEMETWPNPSVVCAATELRARRANGYWQCDYCKEYAPSERESEEHTLVCPVHPMRAVEKERDAAVAEQRELAAEIEALIPADLYPEDSVVEAVARLAAGWKNLCEDVSRLRALDMEPRPLREGDEYRSPEWPGLLIVKSNRGPQFAPECRIVRIPVPAAAPESAPAEKAPEGWFHDGPPCEKCQSKEHATDECPHDDEEDEPTEPRLLPYEEDLEDPRIVGYPDPPSSPQPEPEKAPEPVNEAQAKSDLGRIFIGGFTITDAEGKPKPISDEDARKLREHLGQPEPAPLQKLERRVTCLERGHKWGPQVVYACNPPRLAPRTCTHCGVVEVFVQPVKGGWQVQP